MKALLKNYRQQPRKVRLVADLVRGKSVNRALAELEYVTKGASGTIRTLILSALSNATENFKVPGESLYVKEITVEKGSTLRRWRPMSRGRAFPIRKRNSTIKVVLDQK